MLKYSNFKFMGELSNVNSRCTFNLLLTCIYYFSLIYVHDYEFLSVFEKNRIPPNIFELCGQVDICLCWVFIMLPIPSLGVVKSVNVVKNKKIY